MARSKREELNLSDTEVRVLILLANGDEIKEIAAALGKSPSTIKSHLRLIAAAFRSRSLRHLVALAIKHAIISLDDVA